jgi:ATP-dependent helicase HepA
VYYVRFPNHPNVHPPVRTTELHVRWDKPVKSPVATLGAGGNESGYFHDARLPMLHGLIAQRGASGSIPALLSSAAEIYPHQIQAALTVLSDPVQRYLLADEVGLGKTVQAGYIFRQTLIDNPRARVVVLAPAPLVRQWRSEMLEKFFIDDFPEARITFTAHDTPDKWATYRDADLLIVDEAHLLVQTITEPTQSPYRELCGVGHPGDLALRHPPWPAAPPGQTPVPLGRPRRLRRAVPAAQRLRRRRLPVGCLLPGTAADDHPQPARVGAP